MSDAVTVVVHLLGKEYRLNCPADEKEGLLKAAELLDARMRELKSGGMIGLERIAVMAALNLGYELLQSRKEQQASAGAQDRIDQLLSQADEELQAFAVFDERLARG